MLVGSCFIMLAAKFLYSGFADRKNNTTNILYIPSNCKKSNILFPNQKGFPTFVTNITKDETKREIHGADERSGFETKTVYYNIRGGYACRKAV